MDTTFKALVEDFLKQKNICIAGYSGDSKQPANAIYEKFRDNGYTVFATNPKYEKLEGVNLYAGLKDIPEQIDGVVICTPPGASKSVIEDCIELGIKRVWIHRSVDGGSYYPEAEKLCQANGISCIPAGCPMMFVNADFFHKIIKWFMNAGGKLKTEVKIEKREHA